MFEAFEEEMKEDSEWKEVDSLDLNGFVMKTVKETIDSYDWENYSVTINFRARKINRGFDIKKIKLTKTKGGYHESSNGGGGCSEDSQDVKTAQNCTGEAGSLLVNRNV